MTSGVDGGIDSATLNPIDDVRKPQFQTAPSSSSSLQIPQSTPLAESEDASTTAAASAAAVELHGCPHCDKQFFRQCDLNKHSKSHTRPFKCPVPTCRYAAFGWPTAKELERHVNDKHCNSPRTYPCHFQPCPYRSKRQSNCKQHMEKAHGYNYVRSRAHTRGHTDDDRSENETTSSLDLGLGLGLSMNLGNAKAHGQGQTSSPGATNHLLPSDRDFVLFPPDEHEMNESTASEQDDTESHDTYFSEKPPNQVVPRVYVPWSSPVTRLRETATYLESFSNAYDAFPTQGQAQAQVQAQLQPSTMDGSSMQIESKFHRDPIHLNTAVQISECPMAVGNDGSSAMVNPTPSPSIISPSAPSHERSGGRYLTPAGYVPSSSSATAYRSSVLSANTPSRRTLGLSGGRFPSPPVSPAPPQAPLSSLSLLMPSTKRHREENDNNNRHDDDENNYNNNNNNNNEDNEDSDDESDGDGAEEPPRKQIKNEHDHDRDPDAKQDLEFSDNAMPDIFHYAYPHVYDMDRGRKYAACHTSHNNISALVRHLKRPAHGLEVTSRYVSSFAVGNASGPAYCHPRVGVCRRCWAPFRDRAAFDRHVARPCDKVSKGKKEKWRILLHAFTPMVDSAGRPVRQAAASSAQTQIHHHARSSRAGGAGVVREREREHESAAETAGLTTSDPGSPPISAPSPTDQGQGQGQTQAQAQAQAGQMRSPVDGAAFVSMERHLRSCTLAFALGQASPETRGELVFPVLTALLELQDGGTAAGSSSNPVRVLHHQQQQQHQQDRDRERDSERDRDRDNLLGYMDNQSTDVDRQALMREFQQSTSANNNMAVTTYDVRPTADSASYSASASAPSQLYTPNFMGTTNASAGAETSRQAPPYHHHQHHHHHHHHNHPNLSVVTTASTTTTTERQQQQVQPPSVIVSAAPTSATLAEPLSSSSASASSSANIVVTSATATAGSTTAAAAAVWDDPFAVDVAVADDEFDSLINNYHEVVFDECLAFESPRSSVLENHDFP